MTSWRDIDCSTPDGLRQLDILTAQRLGCQVVPREGRYPDWLLIAPDSRVYDSGLACEVHSETQAWEWLWVSKKLLRYTSDLNAAAALPMHGYALWLSTFEDGASMAHYWSIRGETEQQEAETPALAIVRAWHALMDVKESA